MPRERAEEPEAEFVRQLQEHDPSAWAELYDRHHREVWRYGLARTGSPEAADDLAAQVFLEALGSIGRFRRRGKPMLAWLYTIARNQASKAARRRAREAPLTAEEADEPMQDVVEALALMEALDKLTNEQRDIVALRYYAGRSTAEIAAILGKRERAIYSAEARALAALRRHLAVDLENLTRSPGEIRPSPGIER